MKKGFTLIELLVVIAIIGILAALIIVSLSGAREKAQDTKLKNNARNIDSALAQYYTDNTDTYPIQATEVDIDDSIPNVDSYVNGSTSAVYDHPNSVAKYISEAAGASYAQAWELFSDSEAAVTVGNGVYDVTGGTFDVVAGNGLTLTGIGTAVGKAFVTYGPQ